MPCYQVRLVTVEFKAENKELLTKSLKDIGMWFQEYPNRKNIIYLSDGQIDLERQTISIPDYFAHKINELKRKYSENVVRMIAAKKKWIVKEKAGKLELKRF